MTSKCPKGNECSGFFDAKALTGSETVIVKSSKWTIKI